LSQYEKLIKSKTLLGLRDTATLKEIKHNYKELMKKWHPDRCADKDKATQISSQINDAYKTVMEYIQNYEYSFDEETLRKKHLSPEEWWQERFGNSDNKRKI